MLAFDGMAERIETLAAGVEAADLDHGDDHDDVGREVKHRHQRKQHLEYEPWTAQSRAAAATAASGGINMALGALGARREQRRTVNVLVPPDVAHDAGEAGFLVGRGRRRWRRRRRRRRWRLSIAAHPDG